MYLMIVLGMSFLLALWGSQLWQQTGLFLNLLFFYRHEQQLSMFGESLLKFGIARFYKERDGLFAAGENYREYRYPWPPMEDLGFSAILRYSKRADTDTCLVEGIVMKGDAIVAQRRIELKDRESGS